MTHTKFILDGSTFGACIRSLIHPSHIEEIEVQHVDAVVNFPIPQPPEPVPPPARETPELEELNDVLKVASSDFPTYRDIIRYILLRNSPDCDVPVEADYETLEETSDQQGVHATSDDQPNLHVSTLEVNMVATIECTAGREASPIHMDVQVVQQTVSTSAERTGVESICSSRILMEFTCVDQTAESGCCEHLSQAMKGEASSVDLKLIAESHIKA